MIYLLYIYIRLGRSVERFFQFFKKIERWLKAKIWVTSSRCSPPKVLPNLSFISRSFSYGFVVWIGTKNVPRLTNCTVIQPSKVKADWTEIQVFH